MYFLHSEYTMGNETKWDWRGIGFGVLIAVGVFGFIAAIGWSIYRAYANPSPAQPSSATNAVLVVGALVVILSVLITTIASAARWIRRWRWESQWRARKDKEGLSRLIYGEGTVLVYCPSCGKVINHYREIVWTDETPCVKCKCGQLVRAW